MAASIQVPNGDFSDAANEGAVGGLVGSGTGAIGAGPWNGQWQGVLGLLLAPTVSIGQGQATVSGLLSVNVGGILNNGGAIRQTLPTAWVAERRYTLSAQVTTQGTLNLAALQSGNAGIALTGGGTRLASSATSNAVTLDLLSGNTYLVKLQYDSPAAVSGNIGIDLFAEPSGVLGVNLLESVSFDEITLSAHAVVQVPGSLVAVDASPRAAVVMQAVNPPLAILVADTNGDPIEGVSVSWTAPASGAGATISPNPSVTGADGIARPDVTANAIAGSYTLSAQVAGIAVPLDFSMTNLPGAPASVEGASGSGQGAVAGTPFDDPLTVVVQDAYGNAVPGTQVSFDAPNGGASATLPGSAQTGADGRAQVSAVASGVVGAYQVHASVAGVPAAATFALTNLLDPAVVPIDEGIPDQDAAVASPYACALLVKVESDGVAQPGLAVQFTAPPAGPSALLTHGVDSGSVLVVDTDEEGYAWVEATANEVAGDFVVTAQLLYSLAPPVEFHLRNLQAGDPIYGNGFDGLCVPTPLADAMPTASMQ